MYAWATQTPRYQSKALRNMLHSNSSPVISQDVFPNVGDKTENKSVGLAWHVEAEIDSVGLIAEIAPRKPCVVCVSFEVSWAKGFEGACAPLGAGVASQHKQLTSAACHTAACCMNIAGINLLV